MDRFGTAVLPDRNQTVGIALVNRKTSALFFDRIWSASPYFSDQVPSDIGIFGATEFETWPFVVRAFIDESKIEKEIPDIVADGYTDLEQLSQADAGDDFNWLERGISTALRHAHGIESVPIYSSSKDLNKEYKAGDTAAIIASIQNLKIVDEEKLSWDNVREFRADREASVKLRRMRNWLSAELVGKSVSEVEDAISTRLDAYDWALKKHGILTVSGTMSDMLDPKALTAAASAMAGLAYSEGSLWAAIGGVSIVLGKTAVGVARRLVDLRDAERGPNSEVAFVHELKKLTK